MAGLLDLAKGFDEIADDLESAARTAGRRTADKAKEYAQGLSSGLFAQDVFDTPVSGGGLGHPYGYGETGSLGPRGPIPYGNAALINIQTGVFWHSWEVEEYEAFGGFFLLRNIASYASFLESGTRLMVARPMGPMLDRFVQERLPIEFENEYGALLDRRLGG